MKTHSLVKVWGDIGLLKFQKSFKSEFLSRKTVKFLKISLILPWFFKRIFYIFWKIFPWFCSILLDFEYEKVVGTLVCLVENTLFHSNTEAYITTWFIHITFNNTNCTWMHQLMKKKQYVKWFFYLLLYDSILDLELSQYYCVHQLLNVVLVAFSNIYEVVKTQNSIY